MSTQSTSQHLKQTILLAIPIVLSQLGQNAFGLMDTVMVGKLGAVPLSAAAFVNNVTNIAMVLVLGVTSAVSVLTSQNFGAKNYHECGRVLNNGLLFTFGLTLLIILGLELLAPHLSIFLLPDDITKASVGFYHTITWSILPFVLYFVLKHFSEGLSHPAIPFVFLSIGLVLNFFLNYALIFGHFGFSAMGLIGSGYATLISRCVVVILLYSFILRSKIYDRFNTGFSKETLNMEVMKNISRIGIPSGFQYFFEVAAFAGCGIMMGWLGAVSLAAHQIAIQIASLLFMFAMGFGFATGVRLGQLKGEMDYPSLRKVGFSAFGFIAALQFGLGIIIVIFRYPIAAFFIDDLQVQTIAANLLIITFLFQIFDGVQAVAVSGLRGLSDVKIPTLITFFSYWIVALPLAYILAFVFNYGYWGIWAALGVSLISASLLLILRFNHKTKKLLTEYYKAL